MDYKNLIAYAEKLETDLAKIHAALRPFIAGGSEYSEVSGDLRAIREIGERGNRAAERSLRLTGEMKTLKAEIARLEEENRALQVANRRLQDKLAEEMRLHRELAAECVRLNLTLAVIASGMVGDRSPESIAQEALEETEA